MRARWRGNGGGAAGQLTRSLSSSSAARASCIRLADAPWSRNHSRETLGCRSRAGQGGWPDPRFAFRPPHQAPSYRPRTRHPSTAPAPGTQLPWRPAAHFAPSTTPLPPQRVAHTGPQSAPTGDVSRQPAVTRYLVPCGARTATRPNDRAERPGRPSDSVEQCREAAAGRSDARILGTGDLEVIEHPGADGVLAVRVERRE